MKSHSEEQTDRETAYLGYRKVDVREKARYVLRHFTSIAGKYDFMNTILSFGLHHLWKRRSVNVMELKPGDLVIDVCGGTADLSILAARVMGPRGHVILYDINRAMIDGGKPKVRKVGLEQHIFCVQGDAEYLSFPEGCFDAAMIGFGIRNVTHMGKGIEEMYRVLKPGGKLMCLEFSIPTASWFRNLYDFYSFRIMPLAGKILAGTSEAYLYLPESIRKFPPPDQFAAMLQDAGFSAVTRRKITNGIAVIYTGVKG
ncbi:MAG: bifunctional demethylmenaquinone methyltransferase/2-methoxy-6-polyprenyl-1,4-benzoquinol methylase UbiE [Syntrophales bacterium]|jgi:demethylmenaquinone methyltransferase/2-methoxy-6-polyprenyl-1,4-benzoquinol methylase